MGRIEDARAAYRELWPRLRSTATKCRLAIASLALGEHAQARRWLADASSDPTTPRSSHLLAATLAAVAEDDLEAAAQRLREAIRRATGEIEVDDVLFEGRARAACARRRGGGRPRTHFANIHR